MSKNTDTDIDKDSLWKEYELLTDLNKFYLDLIIKVGIFYFGITGALVSYVINKKADKLYVLALILPIILSIAIAIIFYKSTKKSSVNIKKIGNTDRIRDIRKLLKLTELTDSDVLKLVVTASYWVYAVISISLVGLFILLWFRIIS